jgi:hypothetical protein
MDAQRWIDIPARTALRLTVTRKLGPDGAPDDGAHRGVIAQVEFDVGPFVAGAAPETLVPHGPARVTEHDKEPVDFGSIDTDGRLRLRPVFAPPGLARPAPPPCVIREVQGDSDRGWQVHCALEADPMDAWVVDVQVTPDRQRV